MIGSTPRKTVLDNGLTVITQRTHGVPLASVWVWYKVGSRNEITGLTGLSHWVEHMQFKGTPSIGKGEIFKTISALGGTLNAFTWLDFTAYFETLPSEHLEKALAIESDRMLNSLYAPDEVESERTVIISEREGCENSPTFLLSEEVAATAFKAHPYGNGVIGWKADLRSMTRDDLYNHYRKYYVPNNATLLIVGDFEEQATGELINRYFGTLPPGPRIAPVHSVEPAQSGQRRVRFCHPAGTDYLSMAFHSPAMAHADATPMMVLDALLSGGKPMGFFGSHDSAMGRSSRLYRALVDKGLVRSAGSAFAMTKDPYLFEIEASLLQGSDLAGVEAAVWEVLREVANGNLSDAEIERAKKQMRAQFVYGSESVADKGYWLGHMETIDTHERFATLLDDVGRVTADDLRRVAATYLVENNSTVGWLVAQGNGESAPKAKEARYRPTRKPFWFTGNRTDRHGLVEIPIERATLANGITVLGHESNANPMISMRVAIPAGMVHETDAQGGTASITNTLLTRGTETRTLTQLSDETDSLGMSISGDPGRHTAQVGIRCLAEDFDKATEILADVLLHPAFAPEELTKIQGQVLTVLKEQEASTQTMASKRFFQTAYANGHPFGRWPLGTVESVSSLSSAAVRDFYESRYGPVGTIISITGAIQFDRAMERLNEVLGQWQAQRNQSKVELPPLHLATSQRHNVTVAGKTQSDIVMGTPSISRDDPEYYALSTANLILGQLGLMGRLGFDVRDRQGLAYYVRSDLQPVRGPAAWTVIAGVNPANVDQAIDSIMRELRRWRDDLVEEDELARAKSYLIGRMPLALESIAGIARIILDMEFYGLGLDYLREYPNKIEVLTPRGLREAVQRWIDPDRLVTVVAGP